MACSPPSGTHRAASTDERRAQVRRQLREVIEQCMALLPPSSPAPDDDNAIRNLRSARDIAALGLMQLDGGNLNLAGRMFKVKPGELEAAAQLAATAWRTLNVAMGQAALPIINRDLAAQEQRRKAGFSSKEERVAERKPEWDRWQKRVNQLKAANSKRSRTDICGQVGREFGVDGRTVRNRVKKFGKERPRSK